MWYLHFSMEQRHGGEGETSNAGACMVEMWGETAIAGHEPLDCPSPILPILLDSGRGWN